MNRKKNGFRLHLAGIKRILSVHHMLAMGEVVLLSVAFRVIKENLPNAHLCVVASSYACNFLKSIPWVNQSVPIEKFGIFMGRTARVKRIIYRPFIFSKFSMFLRKNNFDCVFIRNDDRLPYTRLIRIAIKSSGIRDVVTLKPLIEKHFNSSKHVVESYLAILKDLGFTVKHNERPVLVPCLESLKNSKSFLRKCGVSKDTHKVVGLSPTSTIKIKEWDVEKGATLCDALAKDKSIKVILFSTVREYIERLSTLCRQRPIIVGDLPFDDLIALIAQCDLFISVDTGPMHVAASLGVPTIGIFGPTSGKMFGPYGNNCIVLQKTHDCPHYQPAPFFSSKERPFQLCYVEDKCQLLQGTCVNLVSTEEVLEAAENFL